MKQAMLGLIVLLAPQVAAFRVPLKASAGGQLSRRDFGAALLGGASAVALGALPAQAAVKGPYGSKDAPLPACRSGTKNCYSSTSDQRKAGPWSFKKPVGEAKDDLKAVLEAYPQEGQAGIDGGGWKLAAGSYDEGYVRAEFTSKRFKFVDDVEFRFEDGKLAVKSASREGDYDFEVNKTRLNYFAEKLQGLGWEAATI